MDFACTLVTIWFCIQPVFSKCFLCVYVVGCPTLCCPTCRPSSRRAQQTSDALASASLRMTSGRTTTPSPPSEPSHTHTLALTHSLTHKLSVKKTKSHDTYACAQTSSHWHACSKVHFAVSPDVSARHDVCSVWFMRCSLNIFSFLYGLTASKDDLHVTHIHVMLWSCLQDVIQIPRWQGRFLRRLLLPVEQRFWRGLQEERLPEAGSRLLHQLKDWSKVRSPIASQSKQPDQKLVKVIHYIFANSVFESVMHLVSTDLWVSALTNGVVYWNKYN